MNGYNHYGGAGKAAPGFVIGEIHGGKLIGNFPASGVILRVTNVTTGTTVFEASSLVDFADNIGAQSTNQLTNMFAGWYIRGLQCSSALNEGAASLISAFTPRAGSGTLNAQFTIGAMPAALVAGDLVELIPPQSAVGVENYIQLAPGSLASGGAGAAWRDAAFNRILQVVGICKVKILIRVVTAITAGGNVRLGTTNDPSAILTDQVSANAGVLGTIGNILMAASASEGSRENAIHEYVVNALDTGTTNNVGITWSVAPTAGALVFDMWWSPLEAGSYCVVGDGSAT